MWCSVVMHLAVKVRQAKKKNLNRKKMRLIFKAWILKLVYALLCVLFSSHFIE